MYPCILSRSLTFFFLFGFLSFFIRFLLVKSSTSHEKNRGEREAKMGDEGENGEKFLRPRYGLYLDAIQRPPHCVALLDRSRPPSTDTDFTIYNILNCYLKCNREEKQKTIPFFLFFPF